MAAVAVLVLVACALPAALFLEFRGQFSSLGWVGLAIGLSVIWFACLASTKIRQEMYWNDKELVLWNYLSRLSYKRGIKWSDLRSIEVEYFGSGDDEVRLKFHCRRGVYCSSVASKEEMLKVKESILIEQVKSAEGKAAISLEFQKREKVLAERLISIRQSMSSMNRVILGVFVAMTVFFCCGFWYYGVSKNPFLHGLSLAMGVVLCNYLCLQVFRFEIVWDDRYFEFVTRALGIASRKKVERSRVQSIVSSTTVSGDVQYNCLRIDYVDSAEPIIFALRINDSYARWVEETLLIVIKEQNKSPGFQAQVS